MSEDIEYMTRMRGDGKEGKEATMWNSPNERTLQRCEKMIVEGKNERRWRKMNEDECR